MQFRAPLEDFPVEKWKQLFETNVSSLFYVGQAVARRMIPRGQGKIINIASVQSRARPARDRALHGDQGGGAQPDARHGDRLGASTGCRSTPSRPAISARR